MDKKKTTKRSKQQLDDSSRSTVDEGSDSDSDWDEGELSTEANSDSGSCVLSECITSDESGLETNPHEVENNDQAAEAEAEDERMECSGSEIPARSRKRLRNPDSWDRNIRKRRRNCGKRYVSAQGREMRRREVGPPCRENCRYGCPRKFDEAVRANIFSGYWDMNDITRQRDFIVTHTIPVRPKYRYPVPGSTRHNNYRYFFRTGTHRYFVCKRFFCSTLDINSTVITTAHAKEGVHGVIAPDLRGKHDNHACIDPALKEAVREHLNSVPRIESHYLRAQTTREYIDESLKIATLYRMYQEWSNNRGQPCVKLSMYSSIFNTEFNIGFFKPKKDQCSVCETYKNSNSEQRIPLRESYEQHLLNKDLARIEKKRDVELSLNGREYDVCVFDLQAVLPVPLGDVSAFYYSRRLSCYNFTVYNIPRKEGVCDFWGEHIAKRGANEIGSLLLDYIQKYGASHKEKIFYSDNCSGQNKNKFVAAMYLYAVATSDIPAITHKFLITGHTQNEGDAMHSSIEREKSRMLRSCPIYTPNQWIPILGLAKKTGKPYIVKQIKTENIFDLKALTSNLGKKFNVDTNKKKSLVE